MASGGNVIKAAGDGRSPGAWVDLRSVGVGARPNRTSRPVTDSQTTTLHACAGESPPAILSVMFACQRNGVLDCAGGLHCRVPCVSPIGRTVSVKAWPVGRAHSGQLLEVSQSPQAEAYSGGVRCAECGELGKL